MFQFKGTNCFLIITIQLFNIKTFYKTKINNQFKSINYPFRTKDINRIHQNYKKFKIKK